MRYNELVDEQRRVTECSCGTMLVLGGAGTGKTTTALWTARKELERLDAADPSRFAEHRVLFLTFSRTATARIGERSAGILVPGIAERVDIATFHGLSHRILNQFGRYASLGIGEIKIRTPAEVKLMGASPGVLSYDSLLPIALRLLQSPLIGRLFANRWSLVICDEFQDTGTAQWNLLTLLGKNARLGLLADANQMIYTFLNGVSSERLVLAKWSRSIVRQGFRPLGVGRGLLYRFGVVPGVVPGVGVGR